MRRRFSILLMVLIAAASAPLYSQSISGSIVGSVIDPSGLAMIGADVTLTLVSTGVQRKAVSDNRGDFFFGALPPGTYALSVEMSGFKTLTKGGIVLSAAERLPVGKLMMQIGTISESVTVEAQGAVVQTASAERSGTITSSQVDEIAVRGRNVMSLLQLLPGVVFNSDSDTIDRAWNLNINGNRRNTTSVSLDGMATNAIGNNNNMMIMVSQDAIAEVKVLLSNYQAEYGRMSGANVHLVTKSGTQDFHGNLSYYKRHEQFNANNFFNNQVGLAKPRYRYNTYSYNVGGPIYIPGLFNSNKDKLFFFWSQEFWPLRVGTGLQRITVPTELEKQGDFSQSVDVNNKLIAIKDPTTGKAFPDNVIPSSRINSNGQALLNIFPTPNFSDRGISGGQYNFIYQGENENPKRTSTLKVDWNINSKNQFTATFGEHDDVNKGPFVGHSMRWDLIRNERHNIGKSLMTSYKHIFSPTLINELNVGVIRRPNDASGYQDTLPNVQRDKVGFKVGQFNAAANPLNLVPESIFGGVPSAGQIAFDGRFPLHTTQDIFNINNNVTKVFSSHTLKAGFYYDFFWRGASASNIIPTGRFDFGRDTNNPLDSNYAYSNAMLGVFRSYTETSGFPFAEWRLSNVEWYLQDAWKVNRRLTIDAGMRFMVVVPIYERDNIISGFVPDRWDPAKAVQLIQPTKVGNKRVGIHPVTNEIYPANVIGFVAPNTGDPANGMVTAKDDPSFPRALVDNRGVQYGPRIGFAWDITGSGKTALRAGFGIFYNRENLDAQILNHAFQAPLVQNPVVNYGRLDDFLSSAGLVSTQNVLGIDQVGNVPTVYNWSLSLQRDIGFGAILDLGYVGTGGRHLMWQRDVNVVPVGANFDPANIDATNNKPYPKQFLVPLTGYNNVNYREWASSSNYHSFQASVNRRFAKNVQFGASWTWSRSLDYNSGDTDSVSPLIPVRVWNYGLSDFDRTHIVKFNWLLEVPRVRVSNAFLDRVLNHWEISGIGSFVSGNPMSVGYGTTSAVDITGTPSQGARIEVSGNPVLSKGERSFNRFFNTDVFSLPAVRTFGNAARTVIRGPGTNNWDIAVFKNVPVNERMRFQFRFEAYNMFNHTQFTGVDTTARFDPVSGEQVNARFGQITGADNARIIQLAIRFLF